VACAAHMRLYVAAIQPGKFGDEIEPDWIRLSASHPPSRGSRGGGVQHHGSFAGKCPKGPPRTHYAQLLAIQKTGPASRYHWYAFRNDRPVPPPIAGSPDINGQPIDDQASWYGWSDRTLSLHWLVE
jgi:hypothetical protein